MLVPPPRLHRARLRLASIESQRAARSCANARPLKADVSRTACSSVRPPQPSWPAHEDGLASRSGGFPELDAPPREIRMNAGFLILVVANVSAQVPWTAPAPGPPKTVDVARVREAVRARLEALHLSARFPGMTAGFVLPDG